MCVCVVCGGSCVGGKDELQMGLIFYEWFAVGMITRGHEARYIGWRGVAVCPRVSC
jgi:hypothetical protein